MTTIVFWEPSEMVGQEKVFHDEWLSIWAQIRQQMPTKGSTAYLPSLSFSLKSTSLGEALAFRRISLGCLRLGRENLAKGIIVSECYG